MCWILHGAVKGDMDAASLEEINRAHEFHIAPGTKHDVKMALVSDVWDFRLTDGVCDCDSEIGLHDPDSAEVADLAALLQEVSALPGTKSISFCKTWTPGRNKREYTLRLQATDLREVLADLEPNTMYTLICPQST